jgi:hypothetical protein
MPRGVRVRAPSHGASSRQAHLIAVLLDCGEDLADGSLDHNVTNHAEAFAFGWQRLERVDHQLVLRLIEVERVDLYGKVSALLPHQVEHRLRVDRACEERVRAAEQLRKMGPHGRAHSCRLGARVASTHAPSPAMAVELPDMARQEGPLRGEVFLRHQLSFERSRPRNPVSRRPKYYKHVCPSWLAGAQRATDPTASAVASGGGSLRRDTRSSPMALVLDVHRRLVAADELRERHLGGRLIRSRLGRRNHLPKMGGDERDEMRWLGRRKQLRVHTRRPASSGEMA